MTRYTFSSQPQLCKSLWAVTDRMRIQLWLNIKTIPFLPLRYPQLQTPRCPGQQDIFGLIEDGYTNLYPVPDSRIGDGPCLS